MHGALSNTEDTISTKPIIGHDWNGDDDDDKDDEGKQ